MTYRELIELIDHPECLNEETLPALGRLVEDYPYFQTARLLYLFNLSAVKDSGFPSELKKSAFYVNDRKTLFYNLAGSQFSFLRKKLKKDLSLQDTFNLIDSFLLETGEANTLFPEYLMGSSESKKNIPPAPAYKIEEEYAVEESTATLKYQDIIDRFLQKSEEEPLRIKLDDEPVTVSFPEEKKEDSPFFSETLAKIYIKQRKYDKAIEIIHKLSLLYPEKSVYFADQIRFLNKLIINAKK